ncbi:MAG: hypothetical protein OXH15_15025 [Gammaproteobacteria bacterium]|nr:hypothetical protein [Gammaproteobacteria bacterium]
MVTNFLECHLPKKFDVRRGFAVSSDGWASKQADVLVVDQDNNAPLHPASSHELWPVEAVYALVEVKTQLPPSELKDAVDKCVHFKRLHRQFVNDGAQKVAESLFVIWSFDGADPMTIKGNLTDAVCNVPAEDRPDLVVDLNGLVAQAGSYLEISTLGQPNSEHRNRLVERYGADLSVLLPDPIKAFDLGANALLAWYVWFDSWLRHAGARRCDPVAYLPPEHHFGKGL